jgi:hypothetical protein
MLAPDPAVLSSKRLLNYLRQSSPIWAALLGTVAYMLLLSQFWSWGVVVLVCPFVFLAATVVFSLLSLNPHRFSRLAMAAFGTGAFLVGMTQTNRIGTLLVGVGMLLISLFSARVDQPKVDG